MDRGSSEGAEEAVAGGDGKSGAAGCVEWEKGMGRSGRPNAALDGSAIPGEVAIKARHLRAAYDSGVWLLLSGRRRRQEILSDASVLVAAASLQ